MSDRRRQELEAAARAAVAEEKATLQAWVEYNSAETQRVLEAAKREREAAEVALVEYAASQQSRTAGEK